MKQTMTNEEMGRYIDLLLDLNERGKLGYAIARNRRRLTDAAQEYLNLRAELFRQYGKMIDADKGRAIIPAEHAEEYHTAMDEIAGISHEVEIYTVSEDCFCGGTLTSGQMDILLWMVREESNDD